MSENVSKNAPFVSVIVPVYNGEDTVVPCVEALLAQDYPSEQVEILFVDNASKDKTTAVLEPYAQSAKIKLLSETQVLNAYGARNAGLRVAVGEIIAFTDADCMPNADWLTQLVQGFADNEVGCVAGEVVPATPRNTIEKYWTHEFLAQKSDDGKSGGRVLGANCAFRRKVFDAVGDFQTSPPSGGDTELAYRMRERTVFLIKINTNAVVAHRNVHSLPIFFKQSMRYGTQALSRNQKLTGTSQTLPSLPRMLRTCAPFAGAFVKRLMVCCVNKVPASVPAGDKDIYLWRPCLRIINEVGIYIGFRWAARRTALLR